MSAFFCDPIAPQTPDLTAFPGARLVRCDEPPMNAPIPMHLLARTSVCPECKRVLTIAETIERFCERCGTIVPSEVLR